MRQKLGGLSDIKTPQKTKLRSMPNMGGPNYLDLFMLTKEKDRLEQEQYNVDKRKKNIDKTLAEIKEQLSEAGALKTNVDKSNEQKKTLEKRKPKKEFKTMTLDY